MCGSGQWEIDMIREFPSVHIVGIDYKTIPLAHVFHSPKVEYIELTAKPYSTGIHGLERFSENSVDFIVLRDTWFLGVKNHQWTDVLRQVYKILKPGGWLEIYDQDIPLHTGGPNMCQMEEWASICRKMFRISQDELEKMNDELSSEGFINISAQSVEVPVGEWASTPVLKETGYYIKDLKRRRLKIRSPWIKYANKISDRRFNQTLEKALDDCETYRAHATWVCYDAQKPL
ncbi:hypothetical protein BJV82DRAFT_330107 [Fennellomyces sp. T-0311]|nr:hypothetical protein BJV82DRAFT_330107 [Fennellomyces sp. T-0311]